MIINTPEYSVLHKSIVRACSMFYLYKRYRSVTPLDAARVNRTIFHNHSVHWYYITLIKGILNWPVCCWSAPTTPRSLFCFSIPSIVIVSQVCRHWYIFALFLQLPCNGNSQTRGRIGTGVPLPSASYIPSMPDFLPREQWFGIFLASSTWVELCVQAYTYTWYALLHKVGAFPAVVVFSNHTYILLRSIFYKKSKNVSCE